MIPPMTSQGRRGIAFDKHVVPEIELLYRVALAMTRKPADAEDLVQDTLLRAYRSIDRFDGRHPRAWLLTILRNAHSNRSRKKLPQLLADPGVIADRDGRNLASAETPESLFMDQTFDATVATAFESLPQKFRDVVQLVDIEALSYAEAADRLEIPVGTVMSRLHRARSKIRAEIDASADHEGDIT